MDQMLLINLIAIGTSLLGIGGTVLYTDHQHRKAMRNLRNR